MANITEVQVTYKDSGGSTLKGYLVHDADKQGRRPGVLVLHEWWGITKHVRDEARYFAELGYTALVADLYGEGRTADNPGDAGTLMNRLMGDAMVVRSRFDAALAELLRHATVDPKRIGASGYCMGGKVALDMARAGVDLKAVASFHGNLTPATKAERGKVKARIIALNGADDPFVSADSIHEFKKEMSLAGVDFKFLNYPGAVHAFTNPEATEKGQKFNLPLRYDADTDRQAKEEAAKWFARSFL
jgi:dienelactone hydrolase